MCLFEAFIDEMSKTAKMPSWYRRKGEERAVWGSHPTPTGSTSYGSAHQFPGDPDVIYEKAKKHYQGKMRAIEIAVQRAKDKAGNASKLNPKLLLPELEHKGGPPPRKLPTWAKAGLGGAAGLTALVGGGLLLKKLLKKKEAK